MGRLCPCYGLQVSQSVNEQWHFGADGPLQ